MKNLLIKIKYPKLLLLLLIFVITYFVFKGTDTSFIEEPLLCLGYFGAFLAGILYAYGFTAAPAIAILLILSARYNLWFVGLIGGLGALLGDSVIFKFLRGSFTGELEKLSGEKIIRRIHDKMPNLLKKFLIPVLGGLIIASPLPDEFGIALIAASRSVSVKIFSAMSFFLNTAGIIIILLFGQAI